jgi:hypothetical protein
VVVLASCASPATGGSLRVTATLVSPVNVSLAWQDNGPTPAGRIVEYATEPGGSFTILDFLPASQMSYQHRDLMPQATFYYRVVPYFGPTSATIDRTLPPGKYDDSSQADQVWTTPRTIAQPSVAQQSIRHAGAPTNLTATVMNANGIKFTWTDHASDEAGYLIEVRPAGSANFRTVQVVDPNINSCGINTLPDEKTASYRVRAFYYSSPSAVVHVTTAK